METREKLLDAAEICLTEKGSNATSVKAIATAAGVNHGLIHHYFGSKEGLFIELIRRQFERIAIPPQGKVNSSGDLVYYFKKQLFPNFRMLFEMRALAFHMPSLNRELLKNSRRVRKLIGEFFDIDDPGKLILFVSAITGLELHYSIDPDLDIQKGMSVLFRLLKE